MEGRDENGKFAIGNGFSTGRPLRYDTVEELVDRIRAYFIMIEGEKDPETDKWITYPRKPTTASLARFLGFNSRTSLHEYKNKERFSEPIKEALLYIEDSYEQKLYETGCTGAIFALKNFGWKDKTETDVNHKGSISFSPDDGVE